MNRGLLRPLRLRRAARRERSCATCSWMSSDTAICWRYLFTVRPTQLCDRWRAR